MRINEEFNYYWLLMLPAAMCFYLVLFLGSFSPIYFIYLLAFGLSLFSNGRSFRVNFSNDVLLVIVIIAYIFILSCVYFYINGVVPSEYINFFFAGFSYVYIRNQSKLFDNNKLVEIYVKGVNSSLFLLFIETMYRITHPVTYDQRPNMIMRIANDSSETFYKYKINSPFFADSNTTGACLIIILFSIVILYNRNLISKHRYVNYKRIIYLLTLLTFSRAAYFAIFVGFFYKNHRKIHYQIRFALYLALILGLIWFTATFIGTHGSFESKFDIISRLFDLSISFTTWYNALFGYFTNPSDLIGIYTHLFFATVYFYCGLFGVVLFASFFYYYFKKYGGELVVPIMVLGLSYLTYIGTPYMFVPMAFIASIIDNDRLEFAI